MYDNQVMPVCSAVMSSERPSGPEDSFGERQKVCWQRLLRNSKFNTTHEAAGQILIFAESQQKAITTGDKAEVALDL